ncbi:hypothetical protein quinque_006103 [Culex quinquefasciatus]
MTAHDDPDTLNYEMIFEFIKAPIICKDERRKDAVTMVSRNQLWLIEPPHEKYLYVRQRSLLLPKNNSAVTLEYNTSLSTVTSIRFATKAHIVITNSEGVSEKACPLSDDTCHRHPNNGAYSFSWLDLTKRPSKSFALTAAKEYPIQFPDLNACVNESIWCDGIAGEGESLTHC